MTLLNVLLTPQRARVVVDSLVHDGQRRVLKRDGQPLTATKFFALPGIRAVLVASGRLSMLPQIFFQIQSIHARNLDDLVTRMQEILTHLGRTACVERDMRLVVHLVGWSDTASRMVCATWSTDDSFATIEASRIDDGPLQGVLAPSLDGLGSFPETDAQLLSLARRQVEQCDAQIFGGDLFAIEVTKSGIDIRNIGDLGEPAGPFTEVSEVAHATVVNRMQATWTAATDPGILDPNGGIEIRYGLATLPDTQWTSIFVDGHTTSVFLPDVLFNRIYLVKARGFNAIATGVWSTPVLHKVGGVNIAIDTPQLVAGSATNAQQASNASGSCSTTTGTGFADVATLTYTNNTGAPVEMQIDASVIVNATATGTSVGFADSQLRVTNPGGTSGYMAIYGSSANSGAASPKQTGAVVHQETLANGASITATLRVDAQLASGIGTVTAFWENARLRVTAIKR